MPRQRILGFAVAIVIASALVTPFTRELFVGDETKYSQVIREMRATGEWFLPRLEGQPFTHKPPLHFWMIAALTVLLGTHSIWPYVIPSLVAFALLLWLVRRMAADLFDERGGLAGTFVCGTSLLVWGSAQSARMDVSFTLLFAVAAWLTFRAFERGDRRALVWAGAAVGVATLIKGPMAPVMALFLFLIEWWRHGRTSRGGWLAGLLAMIAIPLLWFVPAMILGGGGYTHEVLQKQMANRAFSAWVHRSPPWYYLEHAPAYLFPWFLLFVVALIALWRRRTASEGSKFCISWILAVVVPYSIISSKLDVYMMALVPPVALLIGDLVDREDEERWAGWGLAANAITLVLLGAAGVAALFIPPSRIKGPEAAYLQMLPVRTLFYVLAAAAVAGLAVTVWRRTLPASTIAVGLVEMVVFVYIAGVIVPIANEAASPQPLVRVLMQQGVAGDRIALYTAPHLWSWNMPPDLERVHYVSAPQLARMTPEIIVTSRRYEADIAPVLARYRRIASIRMIGKWFDVYRR